VNCFAAAKFDNFLLADKPSGVSCSFLTDDGRRFVCRTRKEHFTLSLASKVRADLTNRKPEFIHETVSRLLFLWR
jgi:hypothetical protein